MQTVVCRCLKSKGSIPNDAQKSKVTQYKNRFNSERYDSLRIVVPKGRKSEIEVHAQSKGLSVNGLVGELLRADMDMTEEEWKRKPDDEE